jgi:hypothetical protein
MDSGKYRYRLQAFDTEATPPAWGDIAVIVDSEVGPCFQYLRLASRLRPYTVQDLDEAKRLAGEMAGNSDLGPRFRVVDSQTGATVYDTLVEWPR